MNWLRIGALTLGATLPVSAQSALSPDSERDLIETIVAAQAHREQVLSRVAVVGSVTTPVFHGKAFEPALSARVEYVAADGRVLHRIDGVDFEGHGSDFADARPGKVRIDRLQIAGGAEETFDHGTRVLQFRELKFSNPLEVASIIAPNELTWSFSGSMRSPILGMRELSIEAIHGETPERVVRLSATSRAGGQRFVYECVEAWNWLSRHSESSVPVGNSQVINYRVDVDSVHQTRFGAFPKTGRILDERQEGAILMPYFEVALQFDAPRFTGVKVPSTLNSDRSGDAEALNADPLYGSQSFIAQSRIWDRRRVINQLFEQAGMIDPAPRLGTATLWSRLSPWFTWSALVSGILAIGLHLRKKARWSLVGLAASSVLVATPFIVGKLDQPERDDSAMAKFEVVAAAPASLQSRSLCGVDSLFAMLRYAGIHEHGYLRVLRLVRPGHEGTDMATLQRVAKTLELPLVVADSASFEAPPVPSLLHVSNDHFVLVVGAEGGRLQVLDSGRGIVSADWSALRGVASRPMLVVDAPEVKS